MFSFLKSLVKVGKKSRLQQVLKGKKCVNKRKEVHERVSKEPMAFQESISLPGGGRVVAEK